MSLGYAEKLKRQEDYGGSLGTPELSEDPAALQEKLATLVKLVQESQYIVAVTGAGISTSCGIPDFRGPNGVWTCEKSGRPMPKAKCSFALAKPSLTHQVLVALQKLGKLKYTVSQNVDGLHLRSGLLRNQIAELHGNTFSERCPKCKREYIRDFEIATVGFKQTGRSCAEPTCTGRLKDNILDWGDALPDDEFEDAQQHLDAADLAICLGTSLQIQPAGRLPLRIKQGKRKANPGKLVIINLQKTPIDKSADVRIFARVDGVMSAVAQGIGLSIPPYNRTDAVVVGHLQQRPSKRKRGADGEECGCGATACGAGAVAPFSVFVESVHGPKCHMPMIHCVQISVMGETETLEEAPYQVTGRTCAPSTHTAEVVLFLNDAADEGRRTVNISYTFSLLPADQFADELQRQRRDKKNGAHGSSLVCCQRRVEFVSQEQRFDAGPAAATEPMNGKLNSSLNGKLENGALPQPSR